MLTRRDLFAAAAAAVATSSGLPAASGPNFPRMFFVRKQWMVAAGALTDTARNRLIAEHGVRVQFYDGPARPNGTELCVPLELCSLDDVPSMREWFSDSSRRA